MIMYVSEYSSKKILYILSKEWVPEILFYQVYVSNRWNREEQKVSLHTP